MIIYDHPSVREYVEQKTESRIVTPSYCLGFTKADGTLGCGFVFHNYTRANIEVTAAAEPGGITRRALREIFTYMFGQLGCKGVVALVKASNRKAVDVWTRCGMIERARIEDWFADGSAIIIMRMRREECRWIDERHS